MTFKRYHGGHGWKILDDGRILLEHGIEPASASLERYLELDDDGCPRTKGKPLTARTLEDEYGEAIRRLAVEPFELPEYIVAAVIITESGRVKGSWRRDPISIRHEPGFVSWRDTPHRGSAGLAQTLLSTAREMARAVELVLLDPTGEPRELHAGDLMVPETSIYLGAAYMRAKADQTSLDPFFISAGYNAGSVRRHDANPFRLRVYGGADRLIKHAAYQNDYIAVMREQGRLDAGCSGARG